MTKTRMTNKYWILLAVLAIAIPAATFAADEMTVDEIIAKNIETRGGLDALQAIESAQAEGKMTMGGMEAPLAMEFKRPNMFRVEAEIQGMTMVQAFDGETGWAIMPFMGKPDPEPMAEDQLKQIKDQADFIDGPLVNYKDKGHEIELVGVEDVEGTEAYKLKITKANGDIIYSYLDTEYFLEFKQETTQEIQGNEMSLSINIGDYKEVGDIVMSHSVEVLFEGAPAGQNVTIESIELNADIDTERFTMPPKPEPAEGTEADPDADDDDDESEG